MVGEFYHVYLSPKPGVAMEKIEERMNMALDWYRYDPKNWVVYTVADADKLNARLGPLVEPGGQLLIFKLDPAERRGWMPKSFWEWLRGHDE